jgi:hypothetical protein
MKNIQLIALIVFAAVMAACESTNTSSNTSNTENMLVAAGFNTKKPQNPKQEKLYASLPNQVMHTGKVKGKQLYGYKDASKGVVYVGNRAQYQQYRRLVAQQNPKPQQAQASQAAASANSGNTGPYADPDMGPNDQLNTVQMDGNAIRVYTDWDSL